MTDILDCLKERNWSPSQDRFSQGNVLKIGNVIVAETSRAIGNKSELDAPLWQVSMKLPGINLKKNDDGTPRRFHTEDEAKSAAERMVDTWMKWVSK